MQPACPTLEYYGSSATSRRATAGGASVKRSVEWRRILGKANGGRQWRALARCTSTNAREGRDTPALSLASRSRYYECRLEFFAFDHMLCRRSIQFAIEDSGVFACFVRYFEFPVDDAVEEALDEEEFAASFGSRR
jgi:hypothetical protein